MDHSKGVNYMRATDSCEDVRQTSEQQYGGGQMYNSQACNSTRTQQTFSNHGHQYPPHPHSHAMTTGHRTYSQNWIGHLTGHSFDPRYPGQNVPNQPSSMYAGRLGAALDDDDNWVTQKENGASSIQGLVVQKENDEQKASILESTDSDQECQVRCSDDNSLETAKDQMTETDLADVSQEEAEDVGTVVLAVAVDETNIMAEHESYHEGITGAEAERRLKLVGTNSYLTRYSKELKSYVLTVFKQQIPEDVVMHFEIVIQNGKHRIHGKKMKFDNIEALLQYYEKNRLDPDIKTIGEKHTMKEFYKREKEEKERKERREWKEREREREEREEREREEREREERERVEEREQREREEREKEERKRRERRCGRPCIIL